MTKLTSTPAGAVLVAIDIIPACTKRELGIVKEAVLAPEDTTS